MPQISALIHDTYRPGWLDGSCENRNRKIIDYIFLSCGCSHILLALCQECPNAGLPLSLLLHLYSGFMWIYLKTTQVWASRAMGFLFTKLQTGVHPYFLFLFLNHCSFMFLLGLNSTWTKCHNFLLHFADHKQKICHYTVPWNRNTKVVNEHQFPPYLMLLETTSVFWPRKIGAQTSEGNIAFNCKLYRNFGDLHFDKWSISIAFHRCYNKKEV